MDEDKQPAEDPSSQVGRNDMMCDGQRNSLGGWKWREGGGSAGQQRALHGGRAGGR